MLAAGSGESAEAQEALAHLCALYWYPIFAFVRRQGYSLDEAQDLTQSFFTRLIEKRDLFAVDRSRGRFRSFLLTACQHFLLNERDRQFAIKRGGHSITIPIDVAVAEERYQLTLSHAETPEHLYHRQWCLTLLASVLDTVRDEYIAAGNQHVFERLRGFLTIDDEAGTHAAAAVDLQMTPGAVKVAVHRLRVRYRSALLRRIAETVDSEEAIADEMHDLMKTVSEP